MWTDDYRIWILWLCLMGLAQAVVLHPAVVRRIRKIAPTFLNRVFVALCIGQFAFYAASKSGGPSTYTAVAQFITVLRGGVVIDESGVVAKASEQAVVEAFVEYAQQINAAASNTIVSASNDFGRVANLVTNSNRRVIYVASYLPRSGNGAGGVTNHNIAATVEKTRMDASGTNLTAWVWFSEQPTIAPGMAAEIDVGGGPVLATCTTNSYPATETVSGVPCIRYQFSIPDESRGVEFIPSYEVGFGNPNTPLLVPTGGITVKTNNTVRLPFNGTDSYFSNRVRVTYSGGIAVGMTIDGNSVSNGVHTL